jgi:hypothetical protein
MSIVEARSTASRARVDPIPSYNSTLTKRIGRRAVFLLVWPVLYGPLWLRELAGRSRPRPVYFFHVRKSAGTSLARAFESLAGEEPSVVEARMNRHAYAARSGRYLFVHKGDGLILALTPFSFAFSHLPSWAFRVPARAFTLTIFRDPFERVTSLYRYLRDPEADADTRFGASRFARSLATGSLDRFLEVAPPTLLLNQLYMFSRELDPEQAARRIRNLSMWFFTESYAEGVGALATAIGEPLAVRKDRPSAPDLQVGPAQAIRLRQLLEPEYELMRLLRDDPGAGFVGPFPELTWTV